MPCVRPFAFNFGRSGGGSEHSYVLVKTGAHAASKAFEAGSGMAWRCMCNEMLIAVPRRCARR